jgi:hypothetical protein
MYIQELPLQALSSSVNDLIGGQNTPGHIEILVLEDRIELYDRSLHCPAHDPARASGVADYSPSRDTDRDRIIDITHRLLEMGLYLRTNYISFCG